MPIEKAVSYNKQEKQTFLHKTKLTYMENIIKESVKSCTHLKDYIFLKQVFYDWLFIQLPIYLIASLNKLTKNRNYG